MIVTIPFISSLKSRLSKVGATDQRRGTEPIYRDTPRLPCRDRQVRRHFGRDLRAGPSASPEWISVWANRTGRECSASGHGPPPTRKPSCRGLQPPRLCYDPVPVLPIWSTRTGSPPRRDHVLGRGAAASIRSDVTDTRRSGSSVGSSIGWRRSCNGVGTGRSSFPSRMRESGCGKIEDQRCAF